MKKVYSVVLRVAIFQMILIIIVSFLGKLLKPKREIDVAINNLHDEHEGLYSLKSNEIDVLFIGSSHVFCSVSPENIFHDYGVTGYVLASSDQRIWQSYYYLEEFFYTQKPKVVILDVYEAPNEEVQAEGFNRAAIDPMRLSIAKIGSAYTAWEQNPNEEFFASYLIPALRYHDRWEALTREDYAYFFKDSRSQSKGFNAHFGVLPTDFNISEYDEENLRLQLLPTVCDEYLTQIYNLCVKRGADLVLVKYPTCEWDINKSLEVQKWADDNEIVFLDMNADEYLRNEIGIDWSKDTFDGGRHLNYEGAMKVTSWIGKYTSENYLFADKRKDATYQSWNDDYEYCQECYRLVTY